MRLCFVGALTVLSAPLFAQFGLMSGIQLHESPAAVRKILGEPLMVGDVNSDFLSWQYRAEGFDHDEFSHALIFRKSTKSLVSISRVFQVPVDVEKLLPASSSSYYRYPEEGNPAMVVRVSRLPDKRLALAFGSGKPAEPASQIVLIDRSILRVFYPWLASQIERTEAAKDN